MFREGRPAGCCPPGLVIVPLEAADLDEVMALEMACPSPWSRRQLADELEQPSGWQFVGREGAAGPVIAYVCGRLVMDEAEIFRLVVVSARRRQGVASRLLFHVLGRLAAAGAGRCFLEARASNRAALRLYVNHGFTAVAVRRGYYAAPVEDAVLMTSKFQDKEDFFEEYS